MRETLKLLAGAYGATGSENTVSNVIRRLVEPYVDEITEDALGNLICLKKGAGKRVMLAAHMDHIGFVVTDIDENGFLRVYSVGGISRKASILRHVVFENGVSGVLAIENRDVDDTNNDITKLYVDIGATTREEAGSMVRLGDVCVYAPDVFDLGKDIVAGPAMDNRSGCAVLVETLKTLKDCPNEVVAVFTVQEEVGCRGAQTAAFEVTPDIGIALDVTLSGDTPKGPYISVKLGKGAAVKLRDSSLVCHPGIVKKLEAAAEKTGIAYQREVLTAGGTDACRIQMTKGGIPAGVISIPCRYVHSACEAVSLEDMNGAVRILNAFLMDPDL